jgi:hypothetical protein
MALNSSVRSRVCTSTPQPRSAPQKSSQNKKEVNPRYKTSHAHTIITFISIHTFSHCLKQRNHPSQIQTMIFKSKKSNQFCSGSYEQEQWQEQLLDEQEELSEVQRLKHIANTIQNEILETEKLQCISTTLKRVISHNFEETKVFRTNDFNMSVSTDTIATCNSSFSGNTRDDDCHSRNTSSTCTSTSSVASFYIDDDIRNFDIGDDISSDISGRTTEAHSTEAYHPSFSNDHSQDISISVTDSSLPTFLQNNDHLSDDDDDNDAHRICREATMACLWDIIEHLFHFLAEERKSSCNRTNGNDKDDVRDIENITNICCCTSCSYPKYEDWIRDLHPENVHGNVVDHRFYVRESEYRIIWNEQMKMNGRMNLAIHPKLSVDGTSTSCNNSGNAVH